MERASVFAPEGHLTIAQRFIAGLAVRWKSIVPEGRLKKAPQRPFSTVPPGLSDTFAFFPSDDHAAHGARAGLLSTVPPGRNSRGDFDSLRRAASVYRQPPGGRQFPEHALAGAVAREVDQGDTAIAVQPPDRIVKAALGSLVWVGRQRIVNPRPTFLFKGIQHGLLRRRGHAVSLDHGLTDVKHAPRRIPSYRGGGGANTH